MLRHESVLLGLAVASWLALPEAPAWGDILYVDCDAEIHGDGQSWETAMKYLSNALAAANDDQIWVRMGTYLPDRSAGDPEGSGDPEATFQLKNGVAVYGGFYGTESSLSERDWEINPTYLSGDLDGDDAQVACPGGFPPECDSYGKLCLEQGVCILPSNMNENSLHVVTGSGTDDTAVLDGFHITGGNARGSAGPDFEGGGMLNVDGSPIVRNCRFSHNAADEMGGGMSNTDYDMAPPYSSPWIENCLFAYNVATDSVSGQGGGMANGRWGEPTIVNCRFHIRTAPVPWKQ